MLKNEAVDNQMLSRLLIAYSSLRMTLLVQKIILYACETVSFFIDSTKEIIKSFVQFKIYIPLKMDQKKV